MRFEARLVLSPAWPFGVQDGDATVVPSGDSGVTVTGAIIDTRMGTVAGHGTTSSFRADSESINLEGEVDGLHLSISDNFVTISGDAKDLVTAFAVIQSATSRVLQHLSVSHGTRFTAELLGLMDQHGDKIRTPTVINMLNARVYNLQQMKDHLEEAIRYSPLSDARLVAALQYYDAGLQVPSLAPRELGPRPAVLPTPLAVVEFLSYWKSVTTIMGDPSRRRDRAQSRYKALGFDEDAKLVFDELKEIRDASDVAHYSLDSEAIDSVRASLGKARAFARRLISGYREYLTAQTACSAGHQADATDPPSVDR